MSKGQSKQCLTMLRANPIEDPTKSQRAISGATREPIHANKLGDYREGEDGNTTLSVKFNEVKSVAILV